MRTFLAIRRGVSVGGFEKARDAGISRRQINELLHRGCVQIGSVARIVKTDGNSTSFDKLVENFMEFDALVAQNGTTWTHSDYCEALGYIRDHSTTMELARLNASLNQIEEALRLRVSIKQFVAANLAKEYNRDWARAVGGGSTPGQCRQVVETYGAKAMVAYSRAIESGCAHEVVLRCLDQDIDVLDLVQARRAGVDLELFLAAIEQGIYPEAYLRAHKIGLSHEDILCSPNLYLLIRAYEVSHETRVSQSA